MVAGGGSHSVFVDARGGVLTCGTEHDYFPGVLGHGALSWPREVAAPMVVQPANARLRQNLEWRLDETPLE